MKKRCENVWCGADNRPAGLLQPSGYLRSERHQVTLETADPRFAHHYRLAQRADEGARIVSSYVQQTSLNNRPRPAVFVAYAANDEQAREMHKRLWNPGDYRLFSLSCRDQYIFTRDSTTFQVIQNRPLLPTSLTRSRKVFLVHCCLLPERSIKVSTL